MPVFLQKLLTQIRQRPGAALCLLLLLGAVGYWYSLPKATVQANTDLPNTLKVPGIAAKRQTLEGTVVQVTEENRTLKESLAAQQKTLATIEQRQQAALQASAEQLAASQQRLEDMTKRLEASAQAQAQAQAQRQPRQAPPRATQPPTRQAPPPAPAPVQTPLPRAGSIKFLRSKEPSVFAKGAVLPSAVRADTGYLAPGCYAKARLVTGVFATSQADGLLPVLMAVTTNPYCAGHLQGPEAEPRETSVPLKGCLVLGKSTADLSSERAHIQGEKLVCTFPDKSTFEPEIKAYFTGEDGSLGLPGKLERRTGSFIAQTILASVLGGAAEALQASRRSIVTTPFGGSISSQRGGNEGQIAAYGAAQRATDRMADWALRQAEKILPVLWVESGVEAKVVFQEGVPLEGLPTQVVRYKEVSR